MLAGSSLCSLFGRIACPSESWLFHILRVGRSEWVHCPQLPVWWESIHSWKHSSLQRYLSPSSQQLLQINTVSVKKSPCIHLCRSDHSEQHFLAPPRSASVYTAQLGIKSPALYFLTQLQMLRTQGSRWIIVLECQSIFKRNVNWIENSKTFYSHDFKEPRVWKYPENVLDITELTQLVDVTQTQINCIHQLTTHPMSVGRTCEWRVRGPSPFHRLNSGGKGQEKHHHEDRQWRKEKNECFPVKRWHLTYILVYMILNL